MSNNLEALEAELSELEKSITSEDEPKAANESNDEEPETDEEPASEASEDSDESEETTDDGEEWIVPGKFKTADDLKRSYENLHAHTTRQSQELADLKKRISPEAEKPDPSEVEEKHAEFLEAVKKNPIEAIKGLFREEKQKETETQREAAYLKAVEERSKNEEFVALAPTMQNIIQELNDTSPTVAQYLNTAKDPVVLDLLYTVAKARNSDAVIAKERQKGEKEGEKRALKKKKASVEGASSSKGYSKKDPNDMSLEELEEEIRGGNL